MKTLFNKKQIIKVAATMISLGAIVTAMGFGCGMGFQPIGSDINNGFDFSSGGDAGGNNNLEVIPNTRTVGITNFTSVLDAMTSMTNVPPSNATRDVFNSKLASFAETKSALQINAPMLMAYIAVGAEVCNDLINAEQALPPEQRRFLTGANLNFTANQNSNNANNINDAVIEDWVRRFARQFWQRNETPAELAMIKAGIAEMRAANPQNTGMSRRIALYTCTAAIASTSAYEI